MPVIGQINLQVNSEIETVKQIISGIRNIRNSKQISPKEILSLSVKINSLIDYQQYVPVITKLGNIGEVNFVNGQVNGAAGFMVLTDEFYIPLAENIDPVAENQRLQKEMEYITGFLKAVEAKLGNERFIQNAKPQVVENELKKKADAESKLKVIQDGLAALAG